MKSLWLLLAVAVAAFVVHAAQVSGARIVTVKDRTPDIGPTDGKTNTYVLTVAPVDPAEVLVFLNGLYLSEGDDYTIDGRTVTLRRAPGAGDALRVVYHGSLK